MDIQYSDPFANLSNLLMKSSNQQVPTIPELLQYLKTNDVDVQMNATGFLQHITFQNENNKEIIRFNDGIPLLISLLKSSNSAIQLNAAGVLRNMSHGPNFQIKKLIGNCGVIEIIESLIEYSHHNERQFTESLVAILCNLSCCTLFHIVLSHSSLFNVIQFILLPFLGLKIDPSTNRIYLFKISELSISYCPLLEYLTSFLKNMSGGPKETRQKMRTCEGLVDSITAIIQYGFDNESFNCKIVENCICILRNLCYSLQEMYETDNVYSNKRKSNKRERTSTNEELTFSANFDYIHFSNPRQSDIGGLLLLWNSEMIDILLEIINSCKNYSSIEAAIGTVQNLAACRWKLAEEFRLNFRKKKGLPSLVLHVINGPDKVVNVSIIALRNLAEDTRNLELIGEHCLIHMLQCLPSPSKPAIKRILVSDSVEKNSDIPEEYLSLNTMYHILSFIYFLLLKNENLCEPFVKKNGIKICIYLLSSDAFYRQHLQRSNSGQAENANKLPVISAAILRLLWEKSKLSSILRKDKLNCEDFCVRGYFQKMKLAMSCTDEGDLSIYYGKPYVKARSNTLVPLINTSKNTPKIIITSDLSNEDKRCSFQSNHNREPFLETQTDLHNIQNEYSKQSISQINRSHLSTKNQDRQPQYQ